jgi:tight adherence protein B
MSSVATISLLMMGAVFAVMVGLYRWLGWTRVVEQRLHASLKPVEAETGSRARISENMTKRLSRVSYGEKLERQLIAADSKLSVGEFMVIRLGVTLWAFLIGWFITRQPIAGLLLAVIGWIGPGIWLRGKESKRGKAFAAQLPDMLTMLTGSLRAGYGLLYAITIIEKEMPQPIAGEFGKVLKETALGYTLNDALDHLVARVQNDDLQLIVTAIHIQNEVGGSLAEVLDTISRTIRERIQLKGQIQAMTSQQRITGSVLTGLPVILGVVLFLMNPEFMMGMFQPGWVLLMPTTAIVMVIIGNIVMKQVIQIDA